MDWQPRISVLVCTRDRVSSLRRCLGSILRSMDACPKSVELVVVDNGSTDCTGDFIAELALERPSVRCVPEPVAGLSRARNRGVREAAGEVILFADDDVMVPLPWVEKMTAPILSGAADAVGGRVTLPGHLRREWLTTSLRLYFAETVFPNAEDPAIVGPSMAFRRDIALELPFDEALGAGGLGDGETELFHYQLRHRGARIVACHDLAVEHHFDEMRLERPQLLAHARRDGRSAAYVAHHWLHSELTWPRLRFMKHRIHFGIYTLAHRAPREGLRERERELLYEVAFHRQYLRERVKPRRYEGRGSACPTASAAQEPPGTEG